MADGNGVKIMKRLVAYEYGAERITLDRNGDGRRSRLVTEPTRDHERAVAAEHTWPALPDHLRALPDYRAMVRHWVRTDYQWKPTAPVYTA